MPENANRTKDRELTEMAACVAVLRTLDGNRAVGTYLLDMFQEKPYLIKYFKAAYDPTKVYGIRSDDVMDNTVVAKRKGQPRDVPAAMGRLLANMADQPGNRSANIEEWFSFLAGLQKEQVAIANAILDKDLRCPNLPLGLLNVVLARAGKEPLPEPTESKRGERGLALFERARAGGMVTYGVYWDGTKAGTLVLDGTPGQNALRVLVATGVTIAG